MNYSIIFNIIGWVIKVEGFLMLFPAIVALIYKENNIGIFFGCLLCSWKIAYIKKSKR